MIPSNKIPFEGKISSDIGRENRSCSPCAFKEEKEETGKDGLENILSPGNVDVLDFPKLEKIIKVKKFSSELKDKPGWLQAI